MSRAAQFAIVVAVAGALVLASGRAAPNAFGSEVTADRASGTVATARLDVCFAGRPCPGSHVATCFATTPDPSGTDATPPRDAKASATGACPKADVTYHFADIPPPHDGPSQRR